MVHFIKIVLNCICIRWAIPFQSLALAHFNSKVTKPIGKDLKGKTTYNVMLMNSGLWAALRC